MAPISFILLFFALLGVRADICTSKSSFAVSSTNGRLEVQGAAITIKGLNWWGMETGTFHVGGLQTQSLTFYMDFLQKNGFNGLRLPFALDMALNPTKRFPQGINYNVNPDLQGLTAVEVLDKIFAAAASRGIVILLDQHRFDVSQFDSTPLWYTTSCITNPDGKCVSYTIADDKKGWDFMINRYKSYWNLFGVDLANEPHGAATWGTGVTSTDWALASAEIGNYIIDSQPDWKGLIFVEGIESNPTCQILGCDGCGTDGHWWGGSLEGLRCAGVALKDPTRLVYSPHVYSVSVYDQPYFRTSDFPSNLPYIYDTHFGFAINKTGRAVVIGEWGGPLSGRDQVIQNVQANYFKSRGIDSSFYWALNPNPGGDTDGVMNPDWVTGQTAKLNFLASAHPRPTTFSASAGQVCVSGAGQDVPPTAAPATAAPTKAPTVAPPPTIAPTLAPGATAAPTLAPTAAPTVRPERPQGGYNTDTSSSSGSSGSAATSAGASSSGSSSASSSGDATTSDSSADPSTSSGTTSSVAPAPPSVPETTASSTTDSTNYSTSAAGSVVASGIALVGLLVLLL